MVKIVGFSASLRNARSFNGGKKLINDIIDLKSKEDLLFYLEQQGNLHLEHFYKAGREKGVAFDQIFLELKKSKGLNGLSNSEVCLAAALWGASTVGAKIDLLPLVHFFPESGGINYEQILREAVINADGIVIASPVYFGDRSSLSQRLIDFLKLDPELRKSMSGKIYGGVTVGAKRNGGQETALIYQMHDMMDIGALGVGNDYLTTSQYGGTGHAGDVGTMPKDGYGLNSCIGTGRRVARVSAMKEHSRGYELGSPLKIGVWILQDQSHKLQEYLTPLCDKLSDQANFKFVNLTNKNILPCMACDICPCRIGKDQEYRCIRGKNDDMHTFHEQFLDCDVIIPAMLSPINRQGLLSTYQQFLERTRYIRRGDYVLSDRLIAPLVISEIGSCENLNIRMITSLIRHHTVMHKPIIGWYQDDILLNKTDLIAGLESTIEKGTAQTVGRLSCVANDQSLVVYKPVGYVLSACKDEADDSMKKRRKAITARLEYRRNEFEKRINCRY
nr:NAD(P)H-dependent oxidoreductase [uncultured Desulfobacter sp.]